MSIPIQNAPHLIAHYFDVAQRSKAEYEEYMRRVDHDPDPEVQEFYGRMAVGAMERANVLKSEAEKLLKRFEVAGGKVERDPAWGPVTDWIFNVTPRR